MNGKVRTRMAPSPTGFAHMGSAHTALFNYLFAKKEGGDFILRIEDTDKERSKKEYEEDIIENFHWLGLEWDEFCRQSERTELYKKYLLRLIAQGRAYYCFCTEEELDAQRAHQMSLGEAPRYTGVCRNLSREEQEKRLQAGERGVIRFIVEPKIIAFSDLIRGEIKFDTALLGDVVIAKDLETPLYNFTVVVDDFEMQITHVIRGEEHIANTPKQLLLQEALDLPGVQYAHLPLLLGEDRSKLSKRHGALSVGEFRKLGYLPEAVVNFLALLGWNPGDEREIFSMHELIKEFSIERIQKGGAIFNMQRLDWINGFYIRKKSLEELATLCIPYFVKEDFVTPLWEDKVDNFDPFSWYWRQRKVVQEKFKINESGEVIPFERIARIVSLYQERLKKLSEIAEFADFFFKEKLEYDKELLRWKDATDEQTEEMLKVVESLIFGVEESKWGREELEKIIMPEAEKQQNRGYMLWPLRVALSGKKASPGPFEIAEVLGKKRTVERIQDAIHKL